MLWAHKVLKFILLFRTISSIRNSFLFWCYLLGTWTVFPADAKTLDISAVTLKEIKVTAETNKGNNYLIRDYSQFFSCSNKPMQLNFTYYIPKKARHKIHFCSTCNKALCCKLKHLLRLCLNPTYFNALKHLYCMQKNCKAIFLKLQYCKMFIHTGLNYSDGHPLIVL